MAIIGGGIYSIEAGEYKVILMLEICIITVIVKGRVLLEIPSMNKLVQYFQTTLHRNEDIPVDAYARLSAECSIEGLERSVRSDLAFLLLLSFVPHGMYGTPQIKLPTKSSLQHTLGLQTRARNLNKKLSRACRKLQVRFVCSS